jgi:hypothetical protein
LNGEVEDENENEDEEKEEAEGKKLRISPEKASVLTGMEDRGEGP